MSAAQWDMRSIWRKASGKYALTVLGLWVLVSLVSLDVDRIRCWR